MSDHEAQHPIDRLLDAIELVQSNRRAEALPTLRELIREDKDFEDAWLWMSVAVETPDQSAVCLDNVLRINPKNRQASAALYRLRESELRSESHRAKIRGYRDMAIGGLWLLSIFLLFAVLFSSVNAFMGA
jgi:hypothetical protein